MGGTKYPIHPDFKKWARVNPPINRASVTAAQKLLGLIFAGERSSGGLVVERKRIPIERGGGLRALLYSPEGTEGELPCLVYFHGGGFVFPASPHHYSLAGKYALGACCRVLFVDYSLAPKHPFPAAPEDCFSAYSWVLERGRELSIDSSRVAVAGDSAGGNLAAVLCLMARDRGMPMPRGQMLIYPVAGIGLNTESERKYTDTPMCNSRDMEKYCRLYLQDRGAGKWEYASPIHADTLEVLPPAYIETAEFDCLRDGAILYGQRLEEFGVPVEMNNTVGTIHGFEIVQKSPIVRDCLGRRNAFLRRIFEG